MAPRSKPRSKSTSQNASQSQGSAKAALKKLGTALKIAIEKGDEIEISKEILEQVNELLLREGREHDTFFEPGLVEGIISELDGKVDDICSRLEVPVYNTLLRLFLQTTGCANVERGLYLLAATLYQDAHAPASPRTAQDIASEQGAIGKDTVQPLLKFFTNADNPTELRRWAGILLRQLLQCSSSNIENVELGSEERRRNLGTMLSEEGNDILKIICGQVIKELVDAEVPREYLWPADTNDLVYKAFPDSSQSGRWNQLFNTYLDNIDTSEDSSMLLYFAQNVSTKPPLKMERPGHTANIVTNGQTMTVWSSASDAKFDQFLDISLRDIATMSITTQESQLPNGVVTINFCFENDKFCVLNGASTSVSQISMMTREVNANSMKGDLSIVYPNLEILEISASQEAHSMGVRKPTSQISVHSSTADTPVVFRAGEPETMQPVVFPSQDPISEPATADQYATSTKRSEELSPPAKSAERRDSSGDETQERPETVTSETNSSRPKRNTAEPKVQTTKPSFQSQRPGLRNGKVPVDTGITTRTETNKKNPRGKAMKDVSQPAEPLEFEEKFQKLSQAFSSEKAEVVRGVLVMTDGNLEMATQQLHAGYSGSSSDEAGPLTNRGDTSSQIVRNKEQFDSASLTTPDGSDVSTPQFKQPATGTKSRDAASSEPTAKPATSSHRRNHDLGPATSRTDAKSKSYVVRGKTPLKITKSTKPSTDTQKESEAVKYPKLAAKPIPAEKQNIEQKSQEKPNTIETDVYAIDATEMESPKAVAASKKGTKQATTAKGPVKKATTTTQKPTKTTTTEPKKRQSTPTTVEITAAATRSKRSAAITASQKLHEAELSGDDIEVDEDVAKAKKVQQRKTTGSQKTAEPVPKPKPRRTGASQNNAKPAVEVEKVQKNRPTRSSTSQTPLDSTAEGNRGDVGGAVATPTVHRSNPVDLEQADATDVGSHEDSPEDVAQDLELNYYDASPEQRVAEQPQSIIEKSDKGDLNASKRSQRADFSAKLGDLLDGIDDEQHEKHEQPKICEAMETVISPPQNRKIRMVNEDTGGSKHASVNNDGRTMRTAGGSAHTMEDASTAGGQDVSADEAEVLNHEPCDKQTPPDRTAEQGSIDVYQISGNSNVHTPAEQVKPKKKAASKVVKKKAGEELQNSAKRRRSRGGAIKVDNDPKDQQRQQLSTKTQEASETLNEVLSDKRLIDDRLTRKVQIVNFGAKGAANQGPPSVIRSSTSKSPLQRPDKSAETPAGRKIKRTREDLNDSVTETQVPDRPAKRQSISPEDNHEDVVTNDEDPFDYSSTPPVPHANDPRTSKPSSQASRVDQNGSPRPLISAEKVDHVSKVSRQLIQGQAEDKRLKSPVIFGSRPRLESLPKTRPSSPQNVEVRYVKHHKLENGVYKGVETLDVVATEKTLADPFVGGLARKSSDFTERLRAGPSKENRTPDVTDRPKKRSYIPITAPEQVLDTVIEKAANKTTHVSKDVRTGRLPQKTSRAQIYNDQTTLVNSQIGSSSSPSTLTSGSSIEDSRSPLSERANNSWHVALRPHYANISTVAHRLADEAIIQLSREEDVMGLLVTQYNDHGDKLLGGWLGERALEQAEMTARVEEQKKVMRGVYDEAKTFVNDSEKTLKSSSLSEFEKEWRKEQDGIQQKINEGRNALQ